MRNQFIFVVFSALLLSSCSLGKQQSVVSSPTASPSMQSVAYILKDSNLIKIDANSGSIVATTPLPSDFLPISFQFGKTFKTNTRATYVVWFVPGQGMVRFSEKDNSVKTFYQPSDWFYENPYFQFVGDTDVVILIDKKGSEVIRYDLNTSVSTQLAVPYPFGTLFMISPDLQRIAYVEGYQQTTGKPSYLITTSNGEPVTQFDTNAEISHRGFIAWMPDSKALVTVEDGSKIVRYPLEQAAHSNVLFELSAGEIISGFESDRSLLLVTTQSYWYLYDLNDSKLIKRLPVDSFSQLSNPIISTIGTESFLIEEDVKSFDQSYKRLWKCDWMGNRQITVPSYGKRVSNVSM